MYYKQAKASVDVDKELLFSALHLPLFVIIYYDVGKVQISMSKDVWLWCWKVSFELLKLFFND